MSKKKAAVSLDKKVFNVKLTGADIGNLLATLNAVTIKGDQSGTIFELRTKLANAIPKPLQGGKKDAGANAKNK